MSILSAREDGCGFFYGRLEDDCRQINVRYEGGGCWIGYVGGEMVSNSPTKEQAETNAIEYAMKTKEAGEGDE